MVELIPLIEIQCFGFGHQDEIPSGRNDNDWENYIRNCQQKAGFPDSMSPYKVGSGLYQLSDITNANLAVLVKLSNEEAFEENDWDNMIAFSGGYVLKVHKQDVLFPQCCGDLADIQSWKSLLVNDEIDFWIGHPSPSVIHKDKSIVFDLEHPNVEETFLYSPEKKVFEIQQSDLKVAIANAEKELATFASRLIIINEQQQYNIPNISDRLIYSKYD